MAHPPPTSSMNLWWAWPYSLRLRWQWPSPWQYSSVAVAVAVLSRGGSGCSGGGGRRRGRVAVAVGVAVAVRVAVKVGVADALARGRGCRGRRWRGARSLQFERTDVACVAALSGPRVAALIGRRAIGNRHRVNRGAIPLQRDRIGRSAVILERAEQRQDAVADRVAIEAGAAAETARTIVGDVEGAVSDRARALHPAIGAGAVGENRVHNFDGGAVGEDRAPVPPALLFETCCWSRSHRDC